jgi:hypothetical protein
MEKEFHDYSTQGTVVIKRSPSSYIKGREEALAATKDLRESMSKNLNILSTWLKESEQIMPRPKK